MIEYPYFLAACCKVNEEFKLSLWCQVHVCILDVFLSGFWYGKMNHLETYPAQGQVMFNEGKSY